MIKISDKDFDEYVLNNSIPSIVQFSANWCGPCRILTPVMEKVKDDYTGKVNFYKLDIDENHNTPARFLIRGIPTLLFFRGGEVIGTKVGSLSESELKEFIDYSVQRDEVI